jgi:ubiquitin carboxyl-terminal hydrolase 48
MVRNLIQEQFQGKVEYATTCGNCGTRSPAPQSPFYELEIHLADVKTLEEGIVKYVTAEKMEGSNQYLCSRCESLQDATRTVEIQALPEVGRFCRAYSFVPLPSDPLNVFLPSGSQFSAHEIPV